MAPCLYHTLYVHGRNIQALGVLTQEHKGKDRPEACYSLQWTLGISELLKEVAAAAKRILQNVFKEVY